MDEMSDTNTLNTANSAPHHSEELVKALNDPAVLAEYKRQYDEYRPSALPRWLGSLLVFSGNFAYGKRPSYLKFRAVEVIARVPYHSWASAAYTLLTLFYTDERRAIALSKITMFSRLAQDNETMHVVVLSHIVKKECRAGMFLYSFVPVLFSFFYFWAAYLLYLANPKYALELNYLFEQHAFEQYDRFLKENEEMLKKKRAESDFLEWYGRKAINQYDLFLSIRNDEIIHRNRSICEIQECVGA